MAKELSLSEDLSRDYLMEHFTRPIAETICQQLDLTVIGDILRVTDIQIAGLAIHDVHKNIFKLVRDRLIKNQTILNANAKVKDWLAQLKACAE
jgi:hypothetical protein